MLLFPLSVQNSNLSIEVGFILAFIAGVLFGGVLNVIIYRLPRLWPQPDEPFEQVDSHTDDVETEAPLSSGAIDTSAVVTPTNPSIERARLTEALHCVRSGEALTWRDSMPLLGWLLQMGRCRHCKQRLPFSFPAIELFTGLCMAVAWVDYGGSTQFLLYLAYLLVLIVTMVIDWQHHDLYTVVLLIGSGLALLGSFVSNEMDFAGAIWGALVGGGVMLLLYFFARLLYGGEALAFGDVELLVMLGLMLGSPAILGPLLLGPLVAGLAGVYLLFTRAKSMRDYIPVGAAFCFAAIGALLLRDQLWQWVPLQTLALWLGQFRDMVAQWFGSLV